MEEQVVLVDENDATLGTMGKMEAHEKALLHRAFSVFVFNQNDELMLHRRAFEKYHSGGLWTNTCCSHPRLNEDVVDAGHRRLMEEMGFDCELQHQFSFIYRSELDNNLTEHELDHVIFGRYDGEPNINPEEVAEWKWMSMEAVRDDIDLNPANYTEWFKIVFDRVFAYFAESQKV